jgi:hypothetical protein
MLRQLASHSTNWRCTKASVRMSAVLSTERDCSSHSSRSSGSSTTAVYRHMQTDVVLLVTLIQKLRYTDELCIKQRVCTLGEHTRL